MKAKRVFLIVLDSFGIGALPDAANYGDAGANTLHGVRNHPAFMVPNMKSLGLFNIEGVGGGVNTPLGAYARVAEASNGKDTIIGHWEICGIVSERDLPTYKNGFPKELIDEFSAKTGRGVLCNKPYSGTEVIKDYGDEHVKTGDLIVYTSADSVFQIAAHEEVVPVEELYRCCEIAREMLTGDHAVGRVIARPFIGADGVYTRTANRRDYALPPSAKTSLDCIKESGREVIAIGKINDIFAGKGISRFAKTKNNADGMAKTMEAAKEDFTGLCFTNLVDFDQLYGHRRDVEGYARALSRFDAWLGGFMAEMKEDDVLFITADHGCDPSYTHTDHTREYVPLLVYGSKVKSLDMGVLNSFADIGKTVETVLGVKGKTAGKDFSDRLFDIGT